VSFLQYAAISVLVSSALRIRRSRSGLGLIDTKAIRVAGNSACTPSTKSAKLCSTCCGERPSARSLSPA